MPFSLRALLSLLCAVALLLAGNGLLGTLLAVRGQASGMADGLLGLVMSAYFAGFLAGGLLAIPLIRRVGHIRAFAIAAALATVAALGHALFSSAAAWALLRVASGMALVTLYTVIESWLNADAPPSQRGRVFAIYMGVHLLALALGQQLLGWLPATGFEAWIVAAMLCCLALVPVAWTRQPQPLLGEPQPFSQRLLWRRAPSAAAGALLSGVAMGAFWGLAPAAAAGIGLDTVAIAHFMTAAILGGAVLQWPLGKLSDRFDRRLVLASISLLAALLAAAMPWVMAAAGMRTLLVFAFGGLAFALYPVAVAHLIDRSVASEVLAASAAFLWLYGVGATLGPLLGGLTMQQFGAGALFALFAVVLALLAGYVLWRMRRRDGDVEEPAVFAPMLRTTPVALALVPEVQADGGPAAAQPCHPAVSEPP